VKTFDQASAYASPWSLKERAGMLLWDTAWALFCQWTPKPLNRWRLFWLRLFGARIDGTPFVHQRARIQIPWNLTLHDRACLGDRANAYTLGEIELGARSVVAQEAYLCTGTHDLADPHTPLQVAKITVGEDVFIGARAFIMPGVTLGDRSVAGACAVVTKDVEPEMVVTGNPARAIRRRTFSKPL
jgi:putative colanic acid biosynthesis acetyltransferase WcaF